LSGRVGTMLSGEAEWMMLTFGARGACRATRPRVDDRDPARQGHEDRKERLGDVAAPKIAIAHVPGPKCGSK